MTDVLQLPNDVPGLTAQHWESAFALLAELDLSRFEIAGRFYALAASQGLAPEERIVCRARGLPFLASVSSVTVVSDHHEFAALNAQGTPVLFCTPEESRVLIARWGLVGSEDSVSSEVVATPISESSAVVDEFPFLRPIVADPNLQLSRCSLVRLITSTANGTRSEIVSEVLRDGTFYWTDDRSESDLVDALVRTLDQSIDRAEAANY